MANFIAYYRVSTKRQGNSGLGLKAQKHCVRETATKREGNIIDEYTEVESGRKGDRPKLHEAISAAKKADATLIIAKLDRLSRNAAFTLRLQEEQVRFIACDMPEANELTIGIMALLAQQEAKWISERTKAALAEKKRAGARLGTPSNLTQHARLKGAQARKSAAISNGNNRRAKGYIKALREQGKSLRAIAETLNEEGFRTSTGKDFRAVQVKRLLDQAPADLMLT